MTGDIMRQLRNDSKCKAHGTRGFTLLELMITLVIAGIILSVAVPQLIGYIEQNRFNGAVMDLLGAMRQARSAAVESNADVVFSVDLDGKKKYQAFIDNGAGSSDGDFNGIPDFAKDHTLNGSEQVIVSGDLPRGVTFTSAAFSGKSYFHFDNRGFPMDDGNVLTNGSVTLSGPRGIAKNDTIQLIASGHSRIQ